MQEIPEGQTERRKSWHFWQIIKTDIFKSSNNRHRAIAIELDAEKSDSGVENSLEGDEIEEDIQCEAKDDTTEAEEVTEEEIGCATENNEEKFCCENKTEHCQVLGEELAATGDDGGLSD